MNMTTDFLTRTAYKLGEFERLQAALDAQRDWLTAQVQPAIELYCPEQEIADQLLAYTQQEGLPAPTAQVVRDIRLEHVEDMADLLAGQALHLWYWFEQEKPLESLADRARRTSLEATAHEGWGDFPPVHAALTGALENGISQGLQGAP